MDARSKRRCTTFEFTATMGPGVRRDDERGKPPQAAIAVSTASIAAIRLPSIGRLNR